MKSPLRDLEERIARLKKSGSKKQSVQDTITKQTARLAQLEHELYSNLSPWQRSQIARHPQRPSILDYIGFIAQDFIELHGDRLFGDDHAIVGGFANWRGRSVMMIGQEKGKNTERADAAEFWHGQSRRVPKSPSTYEISRKIQTAYHHMH